MKNKTLLFLGAMSALYLVSFASARAQNPKIQKLAVVGMATSALLVAGATAIAANDQDDKLTTDDEIRNTKFCSKKER